MKHCTRIFTALAALPLLFAAGILQYCRCIINYIKTNNSTNAKAKTFYYAADAVLADMKSKGIELQQDAAISSETEADTAFSENFAARLYDLCDASSEGH